MGPIGSATTPAVTAREAVGQGELSLTKPATAAQFSDMLSGMVSSTNQSLQYSQAVSAAFAAGARDDIHGTMIAVSKADIELRLANNVKNKVIDAFFELWRMQI